MELDCYHSSAVCGENLVFRGPELFQSDSEECGLLSEENWRSINPAAECFSVMCSPVTLTPPAPPVQGCFVFSLVKYKPLTYNKVYEYPDWAIALGWTLALASMICIPMVVVIKIIQSDGPLIEVGGPRLLSVCPHVLVPLLKPLPALHRGSRRWRLRSVAAPAHVPKSSPSLWTPTGTVAG